MTIQCEQSKRFVLLVGNADGTPLYAVYDNLQKIMTNHRVFDKSDGEETVRCLNQLYNINS